jgi:streptomycin 6-kinase
VNIVQAFKDIHKIYPDQTKLPTMYDDAIERILKSNHRLSMVATNLSQEHINQALHRIDKMSNNNLNYLVHGDMHAGNMICSNKEVIFCDPKGAVGDPHYDCAMWCLKADLSQNINQWAEAFEKVGYDKSRILAWIPVIALHESVSYVYHQKSLERLPVFKTWIDKLG